MRVFTDKVVRCMYCILFSALRHSAFRALACSGWARVGDSVFMFPVQTGVIICTKLTHCTLRRNYTTKELFPNLSSALV